MLSCSDVPLTVFVLLCNQRRDVGLEEANANSEKDQAENVRCKSRLARGNDIGCRRHDDENVASKSENDGDLNCFELSKISEDELVRFANTSGLKPGLFLVATR